MLSAENDKLKTLQEALGFLEGQPESFFVISKTPC